MNNIANIIELFGFEDINLNNYQINHKQIEFYGVLSVDQKILCEKCGISMFRRGKRTTTYYDLPYGLRHVKFHVERGRYVCPNCEHIQLAASTNLNDKRKCTERLVKAVQIKSRTIPFYDLAQYTGLETSTIKSIAIDHIKYLEDNLKFRTPTAIAVNRYRLDDEVRYVISNIDKKCLFEILDSKVHTTLRTFFRNLPMRKEVEWVFDDFKTPLRDAIKQSLPNAKAVIHKKKVEDFINDCLMKECYLRQGILDSKKKNFSEKIIQIFTSKSQSSLTTTDKNYLKELKEICPELNHAYSLKEEFISFYDFDDAITMRFSITMWCQEIPSTLSLMTHFGKNVKNSIDEIVNFKIAPSKILDSYLDCDNGLRQITSYIGNTDNYRVIRARLLYDEDARSLHRHETVVDGVYEYGSDIKKIQERIS